jgi:hypothetical protein
VPGCSVADDFSAELGDPGEGRLAAALGHIATGNCPAATGISDPALTKLGVLPSDKMTINKSLWQQNRIMRLSP